MTRAKGRVAARCWVVRCTCRRCATAPLYASDPSEWNTETWQHNGEWSHGPPAEFARKAKAKLARDSRGPDWRVFRRGPRRPDCAACGAEIGRCPSECDDGKHMLCGHQICHGCGTFEDPAAESLVMRIQARREREVGDG